MRNGISAKFAPFQVYKEEPALVKSTKRDSLVLAEAEHETKRISKEAATRSLKPLQDRTNLQPCVKNGLKDTTVTAKAETPSTHPLKQIFEKLLLTNRVKRSLHRIQSKRTSRAEVTKERLIEKQVEDATVSRSERLEKAFEFDDLLNRAKSEVVRDVDCDFESNHLYCVEYIGEIFEHLKYLEIKRTPSPNYMNKQREITSDMRAVLIDWLIEFGEDFKLVPETLYLTVNYIDRFLSKKNVPKHRLQLVGVSAVYIASKYEEITPCTMEELVEFCDNWFPTEDILAMEWCILDALKFELNVATIFVFTKRFQQVAFHVCEDDERLTALIGYLSELALLEYELIQFPNSAIALSCVVVALHTLRCQYWSATFEYYSGYKLQDLASCILIIYRIFTNAANNKLVVVRRKYSRTEHHRVASIRPRSSHPPFD